MSNTERIPLDATGDTTLPIVDVLTGRGFITGKSGSGKSNSASVVAEELLDRGFPLLIVDTDGEYWGLKESYELLHVGADEECELQVGPEHAEKLASLALEDGVPIILDVSGYLDETEASELVREVARSLFTKEKKRKQPFLLLVEEIHEYIPETGSVDETGKMLVKVGKRGRKHGLGLAGISQRPADVKKDFITQANWLLWHRLTWENDTKVVRRVVDAATADAVAELSDGEGFLMADFLEADVQRVQVRPKRTFDAGATPDLEDFERPDLKSVSGDLVAELEEISQREERRQDRIGELESELERREETIADLEDELEQARDMQEMAEQFTEAMTGAAGGEAADDLQERVAEIREEKNAEIRNLREENEQLTDRLETLESERQSLQERVEDLAEYERAVQHMDELREAVRRMNDALGLADADADDQLRERLQAAHERIEELERENDSLREQDPATDDSLESLLYHEAVQAAIDTAKENSRAAGENFDPVLSVLATADGEPLSAQDIAAPLSISATTVRRVTKSLYNAGVLQREGDSPRRYGLDRDFIEQRIQVAEKQAEIAAQQGG